MMDITSALQARLLRSDGGMGTLLQQAGLSAGEFPDDWSVNHAQTVVGLHQAYLDVGCDLVSTCSFGSTPIKYHGLYQLQEVIQAALENAREAVARAGHGWVAFDIGPTGKVPGAYGDYSFEQAVEQFSQQIEMGLQPLSRDLWPDLLLIETMSDALEAKAALLAAKEVGSGLPVVCTFALDANARLLTGASPEVVSCLMQGLGADGTGMNCGLGPQQMLELSPRFLRQSDLPLWVVPNAGLPRIDGTQTHYDITPKQFGRYMGQIAGLGAAVVGGCCGTTPEHMSYVCQATEGRPAPAPRAAMERCICSRTEVVQLNDQTAVAQLPPDAANPVSACRKLLRGGAQLVAVSCAQAMAINDGPLSVPLLIVSDDLGELEQALRPLNGCAAVQWQGASGAADALCRKYGAVLY